MTLRIRSSVIILVIAGFAFAGTDCRAQSMGPDAFYTRPRELKVDRTKKVYFRKFPRRSKYDDFYFESFFPIGWSKDGKFAYYFEPDPGESGCYFATLRILDLRTDKDVWTFEFDGDCHGDPTREGTPQNIDALWKAKQQLFSEKLREHGIEAQGRFALLAFPVNHKGDRITATLRSREKPALTDDERLYGTVGRITLQVNSRRKGSKTVLDHRYEEWRPLYVALVGHFKSPFEPRVAAVLIEIHRGWEGPPHHGRVWLVGASLETGFK